MGLRARLDQLQGAANWTLDMWREVAIEALSFIADLKDGVGVRLVLDADPLRKGMNALVDGGEVPATLIIDPEYSSFPKRRSKFVGGPYDQQEFTMSLQQQERKTITLKGPAVYSWNGRAFVYDGEGKVQELKA